MNYYLILPLLAFVVAMLLIIPVLKRDSRSTAHRAFSLFLFSMGAWGFIIFKMRSSPDLETALFWDKLVLSTILLTGLFYYHFTALYSGLQIPRWIIPTIYIGSIVLIALTPSGLVITAMQLKPYGYAPVPGILFLPFIGSAYALAGGGMYNMIRAYRASRSYQTRNRYLYQVIGSAASLLGGAFDVLPILGLPTYPGAIIGNIMFCVLTAVSIFRYQLLDIKLIIRKGVAYFLTSTTIAIPYALVLVVFFEVLGSTMPMWTRFVTVIILAMLVQPLWRKLQDMVDKWFYRERYDFLRELENFSQQTHNVTRLNQITYPLVTLLYRALQASSVHLLLPSADGIFNVASSIGVKTAEFSLETHSPIIRWLQSYRGIMYYPDLDLVPQLQAVTVKEMEPLQRIRASLFVPLKSKEGRLVGLLVMGEKLSGQTYSQEDERVVFTIASRMAVELENALLFASESDARKELQLQNEQKTEFLHAVAHELKTPLTAIISSSELLGTECPVDPDGPLHRLITNINRSAWSMEKRISELLDFARIQIGGLAMNSQPMEIGPAVEETASILSVLFKNRNQALKLEIPETLPPVNADKDRLEQIVTNLLSNANKYSPLGSSVTLRVRSDDGRVVIEVEDMAQRIPSAEMPKMFEPYYRGGSTEQRQRMPGLGLGLAISKRLVELQGGEMWIDNQKGKGNIFSFWLPAAHPGEEIE